MSNPPPHGPADLQTRDSEEVDWQALRGDLLRTMMRRTASPVTVVTIHAEGESRAATIGSFTSVSLEPPLISFNIIRGTAFHDLLSRADRAAVHLLAEHQADLAERFALPDLTEAEQFGEVHLQRQEESEPPILEGTLGVLHVTKSEMYPAGDHDIVVCEVTGISLSKLDPTPGPLVYHNRSYRSLGEEV